MPTMLGAFKRTMQQRLETTKSPDVIDYASAEEVERSSTGKSLAHTFHSRFGSKLARGCVAAYISLLKRIWRYLPGALQRGSPGQRFGRHLHALVRSQARRKQYFGTFFFRNRAELELMRRLLDQKEPNTDVEIAVLACSKGAEVYSILWAIRSARSDLRIHLHAIDISQEILDFAKKGVYSRKGLDGPQLPDSACVQSDEVLWNTCRDQSAPLFECMTDQEFHAMFEVQGEHAKIRPWLKEGIVWLCGDAGDPRLAQHMAPQDMVIANRFLCHMDPAKAENCLLHIARLVKPNGYLIVSGVDLDVRTKVAKRMSWKPVDELIREVHEGDSSLLQGWPLEYWGLEPFRHNHPGSEIRYASVFQIGPAN